MSDQIDYENKSVKRKRSVANKKWSTSEEAAIISYMKKNREFERPTSRTYYNKFLFENGMDVDYIRLRAKVRNMRVTYRKAKEYEMKKDSNDHFQDVEAVRNEMLKICWYLDDFDLLFPNEMENHRNGMFTNISYLASSDDESSNHESFTDINKSNTNYNKKLLLDEETSISLASDSIKRDILAVQTGMLNFKRQKHDEPKTVTQHEYAMFREKLDFEKEKLREEIRIKEKEIESQEKLKIMELQMKERIANKELELKEKIAFKSMGKQENYPNLYNTLT